MSDEATEPSASPVQPSPATTRRKPARALSERQVEALTVAMIVAPGVYARNRMFDLFAAEGARRARARAGLVRGIVPQLARASSVTVTGEAQGAELVAWNDAPSSPPMSFVLRYVVLAVRLTRVVQLSAVELAALRLVAERANLRVLPPSTDDKALVSKALASLMDGAVSLDVSRIASGITIPPGA